MLLMGNFVVDALCTLLIGLIDNTVYWFLTIAYNLFLGICKINIFGGSSDAGQAIYDGFTSRLYTFLGIVMVFIFAYKLLLYIMDPDGKYSSKDGKSSDLIKRAVVSIVLVVVAPVIFRYMTVLQNHIVDTNTVPAIVLGTSSGDDRFIGRGKQLAMITLMSFYHPEANNGEAVGYAQFVRADVNPNDYDNRIAYCDAAIVKDANDVATLNCENSNACVEWGEAMYKWCRRDGGSVSDILQDSTIVSYIYENDPSWADQVIGNPNQHGSGIRYMWIICTIGGGFVTYFLVCYAIAVATRAIKLGVLELIAPIPILMRMFGSEKWFTPWFKEIKKTYLELFLRIAVISFVIYLCTLVPGIIEVLYDSIF